MRYLSLFSGIDAASVAWHQLGWQCAGVAEVDPFPCAVLAHHYPDVPNYGDVNQFKEWPDATFDVLVGGSPCQSFSVAGLRKGLDDPRGNLMLTYGAIAGKYRPRWLVWENVPGVLSSNGGRDFGTFLGILGELGYGFAYRILDAQYLGVPQRRRRVFVVGHLGDWRRAAAVLFERHSLQGHPAPSRETGQGIAPAVASGAPNCGRAHGARSGSAKKGLIVPVTASAITARESKGHDSDCSATLITSGVTHDLTANGYDASEDGTGRGTPFVPVAFGYKNSHHQSMTVSDVCTPTLDKSKTQAICFDTTQITHPENRSNPKPGGPCHTISSKGDVPSIALPSSAVRRLTVTECERLQGFPDGYTAITVRGKPAADGPRYKALGNSMAVPVMGWIGRRIAAVDCIAVARKAA